MAWWQGSHKSMVKRRLEPRLERLDDRIMLSNTASPLISSQEHTLGPYLKPAVITPRLERQPPTQNAHRALNDYLAAVLGEMQLRRVQQQVETHDTSSRVLVTERVLSQAFIHKIVGGRDTYTLLNSSAMANLIQVTQISAGPSTAGTVRYLLPDSSFILGFQGENVTVQIPPNGGLDGFIATVPSANLRLRSDELYTVDVPLEQVPPNAPTPITINTVTGPLASTYQATGPILARVLPTAQHRPTPNAPRNVPGLRLPSILTRNQPFPKGRDAHRFLRLMRAAVERRVYTLTPEQTQRVNDTLREFLLEVDDLNQAGVFTPVAPPVAPNPINGPLNRILLVSVGALRDLESVAPPQAGLPLATVTLPDGSSRSINLRGRIDVGFVIERNGNYGLFLKARGSLIPNPPEFASPNLIGGDLRVETANAAGMSSLDGLRIEEGLDLGAALLSDLSMTSDNGVSTFGATAGYGSGFQYGTSVSYTRTIPLGNINALLPQYPKTPV
jgi:hypothetical protein